MKKYSLTLFALSILLLSKFTYCQISNLIPAEHFGGEEEMDIVLSSWLNSGASEILNNVAIVNQVIDVSDYNILPGTYGTTAADIKTLLKTLPPGRTIVYFPPGQYLLEQGLSIPSNVIIKGNGGDADDPLRTEFYFDYPDNIPMTKGDCIVFSGVHDSAIEDIYLVDATNPLPFPPIYTRFNSMISFSNKTDKITNETIYAEHCWVRGVESNKTRRFHVNIYGRHITVSGCYFHDSWSYSDDGGRGYGVCLSKNSHFCRVENNIFSHLRHSMVFQYNAKQNVMAYNYSRDVHAFNTVGGITVSYDASDLLFHGRNDASVGPAWNLCEGNKVVRIFFDDEHYQNGPYNTLMRCNADDDDKKELKIEKVQGSTHQFMQNVVGTNAKPYKNANIQNFTRKWILENGFAYYWDASPWFYEIPSNQCSYYLEDRPSFYDLNTSWLVWPFIPYDIDINPAKYRYDRNHGYYSDHQPQTEVVYAGWELYHNICGPPKYIFSNNTILNEQIKEFIAMDYIIAGPLILQADNNLILKSENTIKLKPGFKVTANNNYFYAKAGGICESEYTNVNDKKLVLDLLYVDPEDDPNVYKSQSFSDIEKELNHESETLNRYSDFKFGPNPNDGSFSLFVPTNVINEISIMITEVCGNNVEFSTSVFENKIDVNIIDFTLGVYILTIISKEGTINKKIICQ